jgi:hypothetical protein
MKAFGVKIAIAVKIMADWINSPGHRDNILSPNFTHLGVGVSAGHHKILATQEFVGRGNGFMVGKLIRRPGWLN